MRKSRAIRNISDYIGKRFGKLVILADAGVDAKYKQRQVTCRCDCGIEKDMNFNAFFKPKHSNISCGCLRGDRVKNSNLQHGMSNTTEHNCCRSMIERCSNPHNKRYHVYGERGIAVCKEWLESFEAFYRDMGARPSRKHSIDRRDNDQDYCKENCHWATSKEQMNNKTNTIKLTYNGKTQALALCTPP